MKRSSRSRSSRTPSSTFSRTVCAGIELGLLREHAHRRARRELGDAARRLLQPGHDPQQRRLAGAVRAEHADLGAGQEAERDVRQHLPVGAVELVGPVHREDVVAHAPGTIAIGCARCRCYFEDFEPAQVYELGSRTVTEDEIVAFARQFDPQPFHVDPEAAKGSVFGGLIASGWHTGAMWMRLYVDSLLGGAAGRARPGSRSCAGSRRCGPATRCTGRLTVLEATPSGEPAGPRHGPDPRRDGEPGRRHGDVDDLARPLRAAAGMTGCCARHGQEEFFGEKTAADDARKYRRKGPDPMARSLARRAAARRRRGRERARDRRRRRPGRARAAQGRRGVGRGGRAAAGLRAVRALAGVRGRRGRADLVPDGRPRRRARRPRRRSTSSS